MTSSFDPATHLHKQGWKGKGTALKEGHATRPLPVVKKKSLSGIGKDRDEAVPFWDNIFATTAASILSSTTTSANPSPATTPRLGSPASWSSIPQPRAGVSTQARISREVARRGLYSRFFRGKPVEPTLDDEEDPNAEMKVTTTKEIIAGPSKITDMASADGVTDGKMTDTARKETKEERKARKAEKALRKAEKEAKSTAKEEKRKRKAGAMKSPVEDGDRKQRKRRRDADDMSAEVEAVSSREVEGEMVKKRKKDKDGRKAKKSKTDVDS